MPVREKPLEEQLWANLRWIRSQKDRQYVIDVLQARRDFLRLRLRHEDGVRAVYLRAADNVASALRKLKPTIGDLTRRYLQQLERSLRQEAERIYRTTYTLAKEGIAQAVSLGGWPADNLFLRAVQQADVGLDLLKVQRGFANVNTAAVEALWARTRDGIRVSDRIWENSRRAREVMRDVIQAGVASGRDAVKVARDLERYVRLGVRTLAKDYPNMMRRMGKRIPKNLTYEALRLVRTEYTKAFVEGVHSRGRVNPAYRGVKYLLSDTHPVPDVCDDFASADLYGMGKGVYPAGDEPTVPHPNCLCYQVPYVVETDLVVGRLIQWKKAPTSQPEIEEWYNEVYRPSVSLGQVG